jgi:hypothetical protein
MRDEEWTATLASGRKVVYTLKQMTQTLASISAKVEGSPVEYLHNNVSATMTQAQVVAEFAHDIAMR